jgi:hypothetical protein
MSIKELQKSVSDALDDADTNGYTFENWTFREVAEDLVTCDSHLENFLVEDIIPCVREWFKCTPLTYRIID